MKGKLIVIEGTDCSGKETQAKLLVEHLQREQIQVEEMSFPMYETPTGRIIGGPYLGKEAISECWFPEGPTQVEPKVAALYYAADRRYNIKNIEAKLNQGVNVILDRYVYSNMAHQGGKILDTDERMNMYAWLDILEFKLLELPKPDIAIFLHMPTDYTLELRKKREEPLDEAEQDVEHIRQAENAYIELASVYKWKTVECYDGDELLSISEIHHRVYHTVMEELK